MKVILNNKLVFLLFYKNFKASWQPHGVTGVPAAKSVTAGKLHELVELFQNP